MKFFLSLVFSIAFFLPGFSQKKYKAISAFDTAYAHDEYEKAFSLLPAAITEARKISSKNPEAYPHILNEAGNMYYQRNDAAAAAKSFSEAAEAQKKVKGDKDFNYALYLFNLACVYKETANYAEAEKLFLFSLPLLAQGVGASSVDYTRMFYKLADMYVEMGRYTEAESMMYAAVNFYKTILGNDSHEYHIALSNMGRIYEYTGRYRLAEDIFSALVNHYRPKASEDSLSFCTMLSNLAELYRNTGQYDQAEPVFTEALGYAKRLSHKDPEAEASILNNMGLMYHAAGNYPGSEQCFLNSIRIYKQNGYSGRPEITNPLNNLGDLYRETGRYKQAVENFQEAIRLRKIFLGESHPYYANTLNNLALVYFAFGKYDEAKDLLLQCKSIYEKIYGRSHKFYASCLNNLANLYSVTGRLDSAEKYYNESLEIIRSSLGESHEKYASFLSSTGVMYNRMGKRDKAIEMVKRAMEIDKQKVGEDHYDYIDMCYNLAEIYREAGNAKDASACYLKALNGYRTLIRSYFPSLSEQDKTQFYFTLLSKFYTFQSFVADLSEKKMLNDSLLDALLDLQLSVKSLLLRESTGLNRAVAASNDTALLHAFTRWKESKELLAQRYRLTSGEMKAVNIDSLEKSVNELERKLSALASFHAGNKDPGWKDVQKKLKAGEAAVEISSFGYYNKRWTDTTYYLVMVFDNACKHPKLVVMRNGAALENEFLKAYRLNIRAKRKDTVSYAHFWKPIEAAVKNYSTVYLSADGAYEQINLNTLLEPGPGKYLIEEKDIRLLTSTKDLAENGAGGETASTVEVFGYPDYDYLEHKDIAKKENALATRYGISYLNELPGTKTEADSIVSIAGRSNWKATEHLSKDASESALKKVSSPGILHIATHGFFLNDLDEKESCFLGFSAQKVKENPLLRSGLMLAGAAAIARDSMHDNKGEDGILTSYEAANLDLSHTKLVVLSACETGLGESVNGQGIYGLQRAFTVAGARNIVMSLWQVDDEATQQLMTIFYGNYLRNGQDLHTAFRKAQLGMKKKFPEPYFWGSFVMVGR